MTAPLETDTFLAQVTVQTPEGRTSFLQATPTLALGNLDQDRAIEIPGNGRVFVAPGSAGVFIGASEAPILTPVDVVSATSVVPRSEERISFAASGLASIPFGNTFVSETKSYLAQPAARKLWIWNPKARTFSGASVSIENPAFDKGFTIDIDPGVVRPDGMAFFLVQHQNLADGSINGLFPGIQVFVVDTARDELVSVFEDTRCAGGYSFLEMTEDGTIYAIGDNYFLRRYAAPELPAPCILRILPDEMRFDPTYRVDLVEATGEVTCAGLSYLGQGIMGTTCLDASALKFNPSLDPVGALADPAARWWAIDVTGSTETRAALVPDVPYHTFRGGSAFSINGRSYLQAAKKAFSGSNTLYEVIFGENGTSQVTSLFETSGLITTLARVPIGLGN